LLRHYAGYIASGGDRDFMRPISQDVYGIPRQRVIGSATALGYTPEDRRHDHAQGGAEQALHQAAHT
jgi:hypothetical protein